MPTTPEKRIACPSDLKLSLSLVEGELPGAEQEAIEAHLAGCDRCRRRRRELEDERNELYAHRPMVDLRTLRPRQHWRPLVVGAAACLAALVAVWLAAGIVAPEEGPRWKGAAPSLEFRVQHEENVFVARSPAHLHPGDRIRFGTTLDHDAWLLIVNLDDEGALDVYFPPGGDRSARVSAGTGIFLPGSIRLDEHRGTERIFALFTRRQLRLEEVRAALGRLRQRAGGGRIDVASIEALPLPGRQTSLLIVKEKPGG